MSFSEQQVIAFAKQYYSLDVDATLLNGYDEQNFLLKSESGIQYILKIATDQHNYHFLNAQVAVVNYLGAGNLASYFQQYKLNIHHEAITFLKENEENFYIRILTFLEGKFLESLEPLSPSLLGNLGLFLGEMDTSLQHFFSPAINRYSEWDLKNALDARKNLHFIKSHENRRVVDYFLLQFEMEVLPNLSGLRQSIVHNDANDYNLLSDEKTITGLIDFGDMVYTQTIHNLAIACVYAMFNQPDPIAAAAHVVKGYQQKNPLIEKEVEILYYLIAARLCISLTKSAYQASLSTNNEYHFITEKHAWLLLHELIKTNPIKAHNAFRLASGYSSIIPINDDHAVILKERSELIGKNLSVSYKTKLKIERGALQYLYDDRGNTYIDCVNNVSHVGHCHPTVVKVMQKQIATLNTNTRYLNDYLVEYAKQLTATLPAHLNVCFFTNSGSEANDLAIRMSRYYTKQKDVIVLDHAYHGTSTVAMELSPYKFDGKGGSGKMPYVHKAENPDQYRGRFKSADKENGKKYALDVKRIIDTIKADKKGIAAFICETLLGVGGQIPLPDNYLNEVYAYIKAAGGICIADEVQVGFGRVGTAFWGFQLQGAIPDMVVLGKPIGNGHPLAAVITTREIADAFHNGMEYFNTFGGNPVSMATGIAVLNIIKEEELQKNALETGMYLMDGFKELMNKHTIIGDVRGSGLFIGVELVRDRTTLEPAVPEIDSVVEKLKNKGFLISTDGPLYNVLKIKPPLTFSKENAEALLKNIDEVLSEIPFKKWL